MEAIQKNKKISGSNSETVDKILSKELKKFELKDVENVTNAARVNLAKSGVKVSRKELHSAAFIDRINAVGVVGIGRILEDLKEKTIPNEIESISDIIAV